MKDGSLFIGATVVVAILHIVYALICLLLYTKDLYYFKKKDMYEFMKPSFLKYYMSESISGYFCRFSISWILLALFIIASLFVAEKFK